jgi:hypothetical protein
MSKILLLAALATATLLIAAVPASAQTIVCPPGTTCIVPQQPAPPPPPVVVQPPPVVVQPPPQPVLETWWIYNWVHCNPYNDCIVTITVDGLNVRDSNNNVQFAVVNGTPVHIVDRNGRWLQVTFSCPLAQTGLWSDTAGVPIMACQ